MLREPLHQETAHGVSIRVLYDEDPINCRDDDLFGHIVCFHKRYNLGDKDKVGLKHEDFSSWDEMEAHIWKELKAVVVLPLSLHDHSGLRLFVGAERGWDTGRVGFAFFTKGNMEKSCGWERTSKKRLKQIEDGMRSSVVEYNKFINNEVYGFVVEKEGQTESCWGFYCQGQCLAEARREAAALASKLRHDEESCTRIMAL